MSRAQRHYAHNDGTSASLDSPTLASLAAPYPSPSRNVTPARRLLVAVINRAILDFALYREISLEEDEVKYRLWEDAAGWLFYDGEEEETTEYRPTFMHICKLLDLEPRKVRERAISLTPKDALQQFQSLRR